MKPVGSLHQLLGMRRISVGRPLGVSGLKQVGCTTVTNMKSGLPARITGTDGPTKCQPNVSTKCVNDMS